MDWIRLYLLFRELPSRSALEGLLSALDDLGWSSPNPDGYDVVAWPKGSPVREENTDLAGAAGLLADSESYESCSVPLVHDDLEISLAREYHPDAAVSPRTIPHLKLSTSALPLRHDDLGDAERARRDQCRRDVAAVASASIRQTQPVAGYGGPDTVVDDFEPAEAALEAGCVNDPFPYVLFGPDAVERLGVDRFEDAPAWRVERFEYGAVLVIAEPVPGLGGVDGTGRGYRDFLATLASDARSAR